MGNMRVNLLVIAGHLGRDAEVRTTSSGDVMLGEVLLDEAELAAWAQGDSVAQATGRKP